MAAKPRIFTTSFASVYPLYLQKAAKEGRTKEEVDETITWLRGYSDERLQRAIDTEVFEAFFAAPAAPEAAASSAARSGTWRALGTARVDRSRCVRAGCAASRTASR
ncbi:MAG: DUF2200 family protein [Polyangiaceae bacterium]|nr:DUF2200 family protein [Polyangiaceae bacterium]